MRMFLPLPQKTKPGFFCYIYIYRLYEVGMFRHTYMLVFFSLRMLFIYIYVGVMLISRPYLYIYIHICISIDLHGVPSFSSVLAGPNQSFIQTRMYATFHQPMVNQRFGWLVYYSQSNSRFVLVSS